MTDVSTPASPRRRLASPATVGTVQASSAWRSPWFIGLDWMVAVVLAVNATMITLAFVTNPGLVIDDYYERGSRC